MPHSLIWLPATLLNAGLKVAQQPGWQDRGHGDVGTIRGVMIHHTAGPGPQHGNMPSLGVITDGRPDLSGPLANLGLGRDGTFYVVAAGRAYHAGPGNWQGITSGNSSFIGIEAENQGTNVDPWPEIQLDALRRGVATILAAIGANANMCCGHKEYALPLGRKIDPSFDMPAFRDQVAAIMGGTAPAPALIPAMDAGNRPTLRRGSRGPLVVEIQGKLNIAPADGDFGPATEAAVREFQRNHALAPDGIFGPRSWAALDNLAAPPAPGGGSG
jgi:hypothetical protein